MKRLILTFFLTLGVATVSLAENEATIPANQTSTSATTTIAPEKVALKDCPTLVQQHIRRQAALMPLKEVTKEAQKGQTIYKATFASNKTETILQLREDGSTIGMHIVSSGQVFVERAGAQRPASRTPTTQTTPPENQAFTVYPPASDTVQQTTVQTADTTTPTTGGGLTGQLPPTPGSPGYPGGGVTGQLPPENASAGAQPAQSSSRLPSSIQSSVQQQIGAGRIESAQPMTIYQVNVRGADGQLQTIWVDSAGRLLQGVNR